MKFSSYLVRRQVEKILQRFFRAIAAQEISDQKSGVNAVRREYQVLLGRGGHCRLQQLDAERLLSLEQIKFAGKKVVERQTGSGGHAFLRSARRRRHRPGGDGQHRQRDHALTKPIHFDGDRSVPETECIENVVQFRCLNGERAQAGTRTQIRHTTVAFHGCFACIFHGRVV